ncbi:MAG TPA: lytic transglycosylase domain-containing protein [Solirubrobacteraceae bacterium]|nr:lytic transglycosylase domain-containing protein [Solirubrobacteraceae bacterium]
MTLGSGAVAARNGVRLGRAGALIALALSLAILMGAAIVVATVAGISGASLQAGDYGGPAEQGAPPSALARGEIPASYLRLYLQAAQRYGLDWAIVAGVGRVECDHGRDVDLSCSREGAVNSAGAGGPMQFIASTWARYAVDGDGDGVSNRWDAADAIYTAARYLAASGAPRDYRRAIFAYNHASWYVADVESWAARYRGSTLSAPTDAELPAGEQAGAAGGADARLQAETTTPVRFVAGERATLSPGDGHVALVPAGAPSVVQAMIVAGNELQQLPYGPAGHPDPRGVLQEDCSSTINYVLYRSGLRPIGEIVKDNPLAQDYVHWGTVGPGRWVTIYSTTSPTDHTFMTIAGLRLDTSHNGTDVGPNAAEDGPRWRMLDRIPTWAHWSVRHPPGL